jgi:WD40 repeat protein
MLVFAFFFVTFTTHATDSLKVVHPNGGEKFIFEQDINIEWDGVPSTQPVDIFFSKDAGTNWNKIKEGATGLNYKWTEVPDEASDKCLVKIEGEIEFGSSANVTDSLAMHKNISYETYTLSKSGNLLFVGSSWKIFFIYNLKAQTSTIYQLPTELSPTGLSPFRKSAIFNSSDENILYLTSNDRIYKYNISNENIEFVYRSIDNQTMINAFCLFDNDTKIAVTYNNDFIGIYDERTGDLLEYFEGNSSYVDFRFDGRKYLHTDVKVYVMDMHSKQVDEDYSIQAKYGHFIPNSNDVLAWTGFVSESDWGGVYRMIYYDYEKKEQIDITINEYDEEKYFRFRHKFYPLNKQDTLLLRERYWDKGKTERYQAVNSYYIYSLITGKKKKIYEDRDNYGLEYLCYSDKSFGLGSQDRIVIFNSNSFEVEQSLVFRAFSRYSYSYSLTRDNKMLFMGNDQALDYTIFDPHEPYLEEYFDGGFFINLKIGKEWLYEFVTGNNNDNIYQLVGNNNGQEIYVFDYKKPELIEIISTLGYRGELYTHGLAISPDDNYLAVSYTGNTENKNAPDKLLAIYDLNQKKIVHEFFDRPDYEDGGGGGYVGRKIDFSSDGKRIAFRYSPHETGFLKMSVSVYDIASEERIFYREADAHGGSESHFYNIELIDKGNKILIDNKLYDVNTGDLLRTFINSTERAGVPLDISKDEKYLANYDDKLKLIVIWDINSGNKLLSIPYDCHGINYFAMLFSADNSVLCVNGCLNTTNYDISGLIYYYLDYASGGYQKVSDISDATFSISERTVPDAPENLSIEVDENSHFLKWDACEDADYYRLYKRKEGEDYQNPIVHNTDLLLYYDSDIFNEGTYFYVATAVNDIGESQYSNEVSVTVATSVNDRPKEADAFVYPNPSQDEIRLFNYEGEVSIINSLGIEVWKGYVQENTAIDISGIGTGYYFVRMKDQVSKFIKY